VIQTLLDGDSSKENQFVKFRNRYLFVYQNSVHASITEFNNRKMLKKLHVDSPKQKKSNIVKHVIFVF
jgi:hypothetical protein